MRTVPVLDLLIIGGGPAGLTAGLYAGRYRLKTLIIEKLAVGGQILFSPTIENFPGFPGGIATDELIARIKKQVEEVEVTVKDGEVTGITSDHSGSHPVFTVKTRDGDFAARTVIIASGARWKKLRVPGEEKLTGRGVSYCGTCDGPLFRNKEIVVVGGGDKAMEEALYLTRYASHVTVVHRRKEFRATEILVEKAKADPKISFVLDAKIVSIDGQNGVEGVTLSGVSTGSSSRLACSGVFIFIGIEPNTGFIPDQIIADEAGFIKTDSHMRTSLKGIFACGDCCEKSLYQVVSACGEGAAACHSAHTYLLKK